MATPLIVTAGQILSIILDLTEGLTSYNAVAVQIGALFAKRTAEGTDVLDSDLKDLFDKDDLARVHWATIEAQLRAQQPPVP